MLVCLDVDYREHEVVAACVGFATWTAATPSFERVSRVAGASAPYIPGSFYLRELPHLLRVLKVVERKDHVQPSLVIIDGYVTLGPGHPGLGEHLFRALGAKIPVVGVAKTSFHGAAHASAIQRGTSERPLYVTAMGVDPQQAAAGVASMHGKHRVPTMLRRVDQLCRSRNV